MISAHLKTWVGSCFLVAFAQPASSQVPQIPANGVVDAGSYAQPISPGSLVAIFGTNLAPAEMSALVTPLPADLGGTSVTVNGIKAHLLFASPHQVNLQIPSAIVSSGFSYTSARIVVTNAFGSSDAVDAPVFSTSPAIFTSDSSGCGQAAALNVAPDGKVSLNSSSNSAAPGDYISLYGTGLGLTNAQPPDGSVPKGGEVLVEGEPGIWIDDKSIFSVPFAGLAPNLVGVDQINFQIPPDTLPRCAVRIAVQSGALIGPTLTISVHAGRGQCEDPPVQSFGQISLTKTIASGTANDGETDMFTAAFPSGPGLQPPVIPEITPTGSYIGNVLDPIPVSRVCPVPGYFQLSAGPIQMQASGGTITAQPISQAGGATYQQALPAGYIAPGPYAISASGSAVEFQGQLYVGSPIQIQTSLPPGTAIPSNQPFTVQWTGGEPGTLVKVALVSDLGVYDPYDYAYANAVAGSLSFEPMCESTVHSSFCTFGLPISNAKVIVEVSPDPNLLTTFTSNGLTGSLKATWTYRYVFAGLILQ